jgi:hypothetical protein
MSGIRRDVGLRIPVARRDAGSHSRESLGKRCKTRDCAPVLRQSSSTSPFTEAPSDLRPCMSGLGRVYPPPRRGSRRAADLRVGIHAGVRSPEVVSRLVAILLGGLVPLTASSTSAARSRKERGPFLLVALPGLGTVTWRSNPSVTPGVAPGLAGTALGFHAFRDSATDHVRLRAAGTIKNRVVEPGESVLFPYVHATRQRLDFVQQTGAGILRASVRVNFVPHGATTYCYSYLPPRVDVSVGPRR